MTVSIAVETSVLVTSGAEETSAALAAPARAMTTAIERILT